jgi:hypothetical protein
LRGGGGGAAWLGEEASEEKISQAKKDKPSQALPPLPAEYRRP